MREKIRYGLMLLMAVCFLFLANSCWRDATVKTHKTTEQNTPLNDNSTAYADDEGGLPPPPINTNKIANASIGPEGTWEGVDMTGKKFEISINKDGTATSTLSKLEQGKWKVINQKKTHVEWNNGANEYLLFEQIGSAQRHAYEPGSSTENSPDEITHLKRKS